MEYNVSKAISDYYPIHLNYNMIRKNKKSPQQSAVFCISAPMMVTMPPIMLIVFYKTSSFAIIISTQHANKELKSPTTRL